MSEDLRDEVEALNSIYGEGCLSPCEDQDESATPSSSSTTYILQLPGEEASSLRLQFPPSYPAEPPTVLGTQHSSGGKKGAGARDLGVFREALGTVFQPGSVCLFDAVEEFARRIEEEKEREDLLREQHDEDDDDGGGEEGVNASRGGRTTLNGSAEQQPDFASMEPPPWTVSDVVVENKSTFVAHVARVTSPAQAKLFLQHLVWSDRRIRAATHNISAWRIRGPGATSYSDCDDDGEDAAGSRLLHLLQLMEVWDGMVVVSRWYGGVKLGPRRFALINGVARDGLVRAGFGEGEKKDKDKEKGKKGR
ncbi:Protein IMPACT-like [Trichoderma ghanense]|uniref:Protein IMPACT-like n=1 Tax=Trichoderma ghanense TaxID=65468 RepID=A0ABY2H9S1_9HYPO